MKTYEEMVKEYRKRQHDTVVDTLATGLTYMDEIAVDTGLLEETGILTELTESMMGLLPFMIMYFPHFGHFLSRGFDQDMNPHSGLCSHPK